MFKNHFYHGILRKTVAVFGTLFNDITILRQSGSDQKVIKVPLAYGPKQKFLSRIDAQPDLNNTRVAIKLPRISFEITSIEYDSAIVQNRHNKIRQGEADTIDSVPYNVGMELTIMAKNQDEGLQILEQIIPTFKPEYTVSVKYVDGLDNSVDVPISLDSVSINDTYEGDYESRRALTYTLTFTMKVKFFSDFDKNKKVIKAVQAQLNNTEGGFLGNSTTRVDPFAATQEEEHDVSTVFGFIPPTSKAVIDIEDPTGFVTGELVVGSESGFAGVVESESETELTLGKLDGLFTVGETLIGTTTEQTLTLQSYRVENE